MPFSLSTSAVSSSAVLPLGWVTSVLPLRSANDLMFALVNATTWKYCGSRCAPWHTLGTFFARGAPHVGGAGARCLRDLQARGRLPPHAFKGTAERNPRAALRSGHESNLL